MTPSGSAESGIALGDPHPSHETDTLVEQIVAHELDALRQAFGEGAEFAVTRVGRRDETLHRLECPALEPHLDRRARSRSIARTGSRCLRWSPASGRGRSPVRAAARCAGRTSPAASRGP